MVVVIVPIMCILTSRLLGPHSLHTGPRAHIRSLPDAHSTHEDPGFYVFVLFSSSYSFFIVYLTKKKKKKKKKKKN